MVPISGEAEWLSALAGIPRWQPPPVATIVVSPHPDDETLGAGGLIAHQRRLGIPVTILAVTDGEAAYSDSAGLGRIRAGEQQAAVAKLGVDSSNILRLRLPDGRVSSCENSLRDALGRAVQGGALLVAPWLHDPHPDHEACGRVARELAQAARAHLLSYVFWAWHKTSIESLTAQPLVRLELDQELQTARAAALSCHRSQLAWKTGNPVLPPSLLSPAQRPFETFILGNSA